MLLKSSYKKDMEQKKKGRMGAMAGLSVALMVAMSSQAFADTVLVNASRLNYRDKPSVQTGKVLGTFKRGTKLERVENQGTWSLVKTEDGKQTVYVASGYLTTGQEDASDQAESKSKKTVAGQNVTIPEDLKTYVDQAWQVGLKSGWKYASMSAISSGYAVYYHNKSANRKNLVIAVNAGHGTKGGESVKTYCHPDQSAKVTSGTTSAGATKAVAVSGGMTFADGTPEKTVTLRMAQILRKKLLAAGYDVLMIRDGEDVQLDNVARCVIANNTADCHISLHWDSTESNKGAFYLSVPDNATYRSMEPVASHWKEHNRLGSSLLDGLKQKNVKIYSSGSMAMDLTQTSYSTIPSMDMELGDKKSAHDDSTLETLADGLVLGVNKFFGQ